MNNRIRNKITAYTVQDVLDTCFLKDGQVWAYGRPNNKAKYRQVDYCVNHQKKVRVTETGVKPVGAALILTVHYILVHKKLPSGPVFMNDNNEPIYVNERLGSIMRNKNQSHLYHFTDGKSRIKSIGARLQDMNGNRQVELFKTRREALSAIPVMFEKYWGDELRKYNLHNTYFSKD